MINWGGVNDEPFFTVSRSRRLLLYAFLGATDKVISKHAPLYFTA